MSFLIYDVIICFSKMFALQRRKYCVERSSNNIILSCPVCVRIVPLSDSETNNTICSKECLSVCLSHQMHDNHAFDVTNRPTGILCCPQGRLVINLKIKTHFGFEKYLELLRRLFPFSYYVWFSSNFHIYYIVMYIYIISKIFMSTMPAFPFFGQKQRFFAISNFSHLVIVFVVIVDLNDQQIIMVHKTFKHMSYQR